MTKCRFVGSRIVLCVEFGQGGSHQIAEYFLEFLDFGI